MIQVRCVCVGVASLVAFLCTIALADERTEPRVEMAALSNDVFANEVVQVVVQITAPADHSVRVIKPGQLDHYANVEYATLAGRRASAGPRGPSPNRSHAPEKFRDLGPGSIARARTFWKAPMLGEPGDYVLHAWARPVFNAGPFQQDIKVTVRPFRAESVKQRVVVSPPAKAPARLPDAELLVIDAGGTWLFLAGDLGKDGLPSLMRLWRVPPDAQIVGAIDNYSKDGDAGSVRIEHTERGQRYAGVIDLVTGQVLVEPEPIPPALPEAQRPQPPDLRN